MSILRFAGPFAFIVAVPVLYGVSPAAPLAVPAAILLSLLIASLVTAAGMPSRPSGIDPRILPLGYVALQLCVTAWATMESAAATGLGFLSLYVSVGVCTGVFGVLAAHELTHSHRDWHRFFGSLLLTGMSYRHFRTAHIYVHHRFAVSERDASASRADESFYAFLARTVIAQWREAGCFEDRRGRKTSHRWLHNRVTQDALLLCGLVSALGRFLGWRPMAFFALQSVIAIVVLELFNYVAHYRLSRGQGEALQDHHSWNSTGAENFLLFNMGCHSDHHRRPALHYDALRRIENVPALPGGYAGAILLALVPPLWRAVMHPRIFILAASRQNSVYGDGRPALATQ